MSRQMQRARARHSTQPRRTASTLRPAPSPIRRRLRSFGGPCRQQALREVVRRIAIHAAAADGGPPESPQVRASRSPMCRCIAADPSVGGAPSSRLRAARRRPAATARPHRTRRLQPPRPRRRPRRRRRAAAVTIGTEPGGAPAVRGSCAAVRRRRGATNRHVVVVVAAAIRQALVRAAAAAAATAATAAAAAATAATATAAAALACVRYRCRLHEAPIGVGHLHSRCGVVVGSCEVVGQSQPVRIDDTTTSPACILVRAGTRIIPLVGAWRSGG